MNTDIRTTSSAGTLPFAELEQLYDALADAIDAAGPEREMLLLTRLALIMAHLDGDAQRFRAALAMARDGLPAAADGDRAP
ncbi:MAG: hypothetical protein KJO38_05450 [Gammaproteobacteria bacterium]|nr:hypothetical protein [Gammaproteobacteria bacterium]